MGRASRDKQFLNKFVMTVTHCPVHETTGVDLVCFHFAERIEDADGSPKVICVNFSVRNDEELLFKRSLFYCEICAKDFGLPSESAEVSEERFHSMEQAGKFAAVCWKCFRGAFDLID